MESLPPEQQCWVIQPLLDAGLDMQHIRDLLFRLCFDDLVSAGRDTVVCVRTLVRDQPDAVQAAWAESIGRMLALNVPPRDAPDPVR